MTAPYMTCFSCGVTERDLNGLQVHCLDVNCTLNKESQGRRWHLLCGACVVKCDDALITDKNRFISNGLRTTFEAVTVSSCPTKEFFAARRMMA